MDDSPVCLRRVDDLLFDCEGSWFHSLNFAFASCVGPSRHISGQRADMRGDILNMCAVLTLSGKKLQDAFAKCAPLSRFAAPLGGRLALLDNAAVLNLCRSSTLFRSIPGCEAFKM